MEKDRELLNNFNINEDEYQKIISNFIVNGKLKNFPAKTRKQIAIYVYFYHLFSDREYTEKEVNEIIKNTYDDFSTIRRALVDYRLLNREINCSKYTKNK